LISNLKRNQKSKFPSGRNFAFDIFDILEGETQEKCGVSDFQNWTFIKRVSRSRFDRSLMEIEGRRHRHIFHRFRSKPALFRERRLASHRHSTL